MWGKRHKRRPEGFPSPDAVRSWFRSPAGQVLLDEERGLLEQRLPDLFGYYLVQLGFLGQSPESALATRVRERLVIDPCTPAPGGIASGLAAWERLPICTDCVDVALLVHTLDFAADPYQVLREVERILIPEGRVVIVGFNVLSLWGMRRLWPPGRTRLPWRGRFVATYRIIDWLSLLGFDLERVDRLMFRPPVWGMGMMSRLAFLERLGERFWPLLSSVYVIQAVKRVSTLTPIQPAWRTRRGLLPGKAVEPTARG
jgi:SAM-dependent methyltransferase